MMSGDINFKHSNMAEKRLIYQVQKMRDGQAEKEKHFLRYHVDYLFYWGSSFLELK